MNPVFSCLTDKVLLRAAGCGISLDGISFSSNKVVQLGQLDDERIIVILEERLGIEPSSEDRLEMPLSLFLGSSVSLPRLSRLRQWGCVRRAS